MRARVAGVLAAALVLGPSAGPQAASAKTSVSGTYEISIAGWNLARVNLRLELGGGRYDADLSMRPAGVATIVTAVRTEVAADGRFGNGAVSPQNYTVRAEEIERPVVVDMKLARNAVTAVRAEPPMRGKGRVPVTSAHKRGIVDPLSSGLVPIAGDDLRGACDHVLKIFDGWTRYDVTLYHKGETRVSTAGYSGPAVVCGARWVPVSGHRPTKKEVQYLAANRALEMTLVPLPGEGFAIPYQVRIGTPNGEIVIKPSALSIKGAGA